MTPTCRQNEHFEKQYCWLTGLVAEYSLSMNPWSQVLTECLSTWSIWRTRLSWPSRSFGMLRSTILASSSGLLRSTRGRTAVFDSLFLLAASPFEEAWPLPLAVPFAGGRSLDTSPA